ncbi:MAG: GGDEF domain-containing protein [Cognaticolwellia sp.]|jgi:GGDEF domain-containing protein
MIIVHDGRSLSIKKSLGVAYFNEQMNKLEDLIKHADIA